MPSTTLLQNSIIQVWHHLQQINNIGESRDFNDVYYVIDYLVHAVRSVYPQIPCQEGCSMCCKSSGLPRTTALEWRQIHRYIVEELDCATQTTLILQNYELHCDQVPQLLAEQSRIQSLYSDQTVPAFNCFQCPLLINDRCSIYPVRPAICRGYGYFTLRKAPQDSSIFACRMAGDTLVNSLKEKGIEQLALPVWNKFSDKVYELNQSLGTVSTLPLWIFSHVEHGAFKIKVDLRPDFNRLYQNAERGMRNAELGKP